MTTSTFSLGADPVTDLALPLRLETQLIAELDGDDLNRRALVHDAVETAINERLAESGWDGGRSASDVVTAVLAVADEATEIERAIDASDFATLTVRHELREDAEHDHGDEQGTALVLTDDQGVVLLSRPYRLPAKADDDGVTYWAAFRAADAYLEAWLRLHGIDPTATDTFGTGWSVTFSRRAWR